MSQPLIARKLVPRQLSYIPNALLIGKTGVGKTTLAKKLSKIKHEANVAESNMQQGENVYTVVCDRNTFVLTDTLGIGITTISNTHADSREINIKVKISTIFFVIKYDSRFERMISVYFELETSVVEDIDRIVVMISYWDQSKTPEKDFKEICDLFAEECPHIANIIFYSEQDADVELAKWIYNCISNMEKVELTDRVSEDETINKCSDSICSDSEDDNDAHSMITNDSDHEKEERRPEKNNLKRTFYQFQEDSDSFSMLPEENGTGSDEFNINIQQPMSCNSFENTKYNDQTNEYVAGDNPKKRKQDNSSPTFWQRWYNYYCCIS